MYQKILARNSLIYIGLHCVRISKLCYTVYKFTDQYTNQWIIDTQSNESHDSSWFFFQYALYAHTTKLFFQLRLTTYLLHTQQGRRKVWGGSSSIVLGIICLPPFQVGLGLTDLTKSGGEGEDSPSRFLRPCSEFRWTE